MRSFALAAAALAALLLASPPPALAETAPPTPKPDAAADRAAARDALFLALKNAATREEAAALEARIWSFWYVGPTAEATAALERARELMALNAGGRAYRKLTAIIETYPDWAEPYNQRAILLFTRGNDDASLADISRVLTREPKHFGALSGGAQIHLRNGRPVAAARDLEAAIEIHPWIGGRTPKRTPKPATTL